MDRQRWEYRVVSAVAFQAGTVETQLNIMGNDGWELAVGLSEVGAYGSTAVQYLIFKRMQVEAEPAPKPSPFPDFPR
ncbi:MAG: hypothetical protein NVS2B16_37760 [Chloroflexota bacterium]